MTKLEKLRENLECNVIELKEAWGEYEKQRKATDANGDSLEKSDRVAILVKQMLEVVSKSNDALEGYSVYATLWTCIVIIWTVQITIKAKLVVSWFFFVL